jgi:hypothetical protein
MKASGCNSGCSTIDRRSLLTRTAPACAAACLGFGKFAGLSALVGDPKIQNQHKFDVQTDVPMSSRQRAGMMYRGMAGVVEVLKNQLGESETIRLLNISSADVGRQVGGRQAQSSPNTNFQAFVQVFRPPNYANSLTHEVVEDTEKVFALEVTECINAELLQSIGLGGEIGHAIVCNMDYYWPTAFNPAFKMERTKTLMQGDEVCNHRYINTA